MPCWEKRTYTNKIVTSGDSTVDYKAMVKGLDAVGLRLESTSTGSQAIVEQLGGRHLGYLQRNELQIESRYQSEQEVEEVTRRVRQAYSIGVALIEAGKNYWSPSVEKVGDNYVIRTKVNY